MKVVVTKKELDDLGFDFSEIPVFVNDELFTIQSCEMGFTVFKNITMDEIFTPDQIDTEFLISEMEKMGLL